MFWFILGFSVACTERAARSKAKMPQQLSPQVASDIYDGAIWLVNQAVEIVQICVTTTQPCINQMKDRSISATVGCYNHQYSLADELRGAFTEFFTSSRTQRPFIKPDSA